MVARQGKQRFDSRWLCHCFLSVLKSSSVGGIHVRYGARISAEATTHSSLLSSSSLLSPPSSSASATTDSSPGWCSMAFIAANCRGVLFSSHRVPRWCDYAFYFLGSAFQDAQTYTFREYVTCSWWKPNGLFGEEKRGGWYDT
jgi:hypothetical protein